MALSRNTYQRNSSWNAPYTFSGKEKDAETGYGYFGARYYDSGLSIWLSVDPMSDKYPSMSPYNYCANNPVMLVDPNGKEIAEGSRKEWNMHKSKINDRMASLLVYYTLNTLSKGLLYKEEAEMYVSLENTINGMEQMEKSGNVYHISNGSPVGFGSITNNGDGEYTINIYNQNTAIFVHEVNHCIQFENNEIVFGEGTSLTISDVYDELECYTAQWAYDPSSIPINNEPKLTISWVLAITRNDGSKVYNKIGKSPVNANSSWSDLNRAFNNTIQQFEGPLKNLPGIISN